MSIPLETMTRLELVKTVKRNEILASVELAEARLQRDVIIGAFVSLVKGIHEEDEELIIMSMKTGTEAVQMIGQTSGGGHWEEMLTSAPVISEEDLNGPIRV